MVMLPSGNEKTADELFCGSRNHFTNVELCRPPASNLIQMDSPGFWLRSLEGVSYTGREETRKLIWIHAHGSLHDHPQNTRHET